MAKTAGEGPQALARRRLRMADGERGAELGRTGHGAVIGDFPDGLTFEDFGGIAGGEPGDRVDVVRDDDGARGAYAFVLHFAQHQRGVAQAGEFQGGGYEGDIGDVERRHHRVVQDARCVDEHVVEGPRGEGDEALDIGRRGRQPFGEALGGAEQEDAGVVHREVPLERLELELGLVA